MKVLEIIGAIVVAIVIFKGAASWYNYQVRANKALRESLKKSKRSKES